MIYSFIGVIVVFICVFYLTHDHNTNDLRSFREIWIAARNRYMRFWISNPKAELILLGFNSLYKSTHKHIDLVKSVKLLHITIGLAALICAVVMRNITYSLVVLPITISFFYIKGVKVSQKSREDLIKQLPDVFRSIGMMLASGKTLMQACSYVAEHTDGLISQAFGSCAMSMQLGVGREDALKSLAKTLNNDCMQLVICAIEVSQLTGAPLQDLLYKAALLLEDQQKVADYIQVKTAQAQTSVKVVVLLPAIIVCSLAFLSPEFREGLVTKTGAISLILAAVLDMLAILIIRKLMRSVERDVIS